MSERSAIVSDTGPLISFEKLPRGHDLLRQLYQRVFVPLSVLQELAEKHFNRAEDYLHHYQITDLIEVVEPPSDQEFLVLDRLDRGEADAIRLAKALRLPLMIEETVGRRVARELGLHFSGAAGQVIKAYRGELLSGREATRALRELVAHGRINHDIYRALSGEIRGRRH